MDRTFAQFADCLALNNTTYIPCEDTSLGTADAANKKIQATSLLALLGGAAVASAQTFTAQNNFGPAAPASFSRKSSYLNVVDQGGNDAVLAVQAYNSSSQSTRGARLVLFKARGSASSVSGTAQGDLIGSVEYVATPNGVLNYTQIAMVVNQATASAWEGNLSFQSYLYGESMRFNYKGVLQLAGTAMNDNVSTTNRLVINNSGLSHPPGTSSTALVYVVNSSGNSQIPVVVRSHGLNTNCSLLELRTGIDVDDGQYQVKFVHSGSGQRINSVFSGAVLATNATDGFIYLPSCAGAPSAAPTAYSGTIPVVVDSTNNALYAYANGAWQKVGDAARAGISGTPAANQIAVFASASQVSGSAGLTYDGTNFTAAGTGVHFTFDAVSDTLTATFRAKSATTIWQWGHRGAAGANRAGVYYYNGTTFSAELMTWTTTGQFGFNKTASHVAQVDIVSGATGRPGLLVRAATGDGATATLASFRDAGNNEVLKVLCGGQLSYISANTATTVGAAGGASALPATPVGYLLVDLAGTTVKVPYYNN